ncbi:TetR/AcrR family transcriptional regulator (plasmid) [Deinococcus taeanensis]|uniref:TetR/AcrR family transcriptional regulator n=1 Tax=Deinococcus taeanensis TaxID=2737050 RepID=UPI001CDC1778|nr:TetR/AcrR family transcriptional regulator [Deinococcus taeanensis]UBV44402.1 TetR/AcrR family transcriptional regulator [Deinococcus taeanensis]
MSPSDPRPRDAAATREAILAAATQVFAERGYAAAGMQDIATLAGVARATPSYFFGSKAQLWQATLERQGARVAAIVPGVLARTGPDPTRDTLKAALVDGLLAFHHTHPEALRLIHWAELQGGDLLPQRPAHAAAVQSALTLLRQLEPDLPAQEARHLTLTLLGACYAHLSYGRTFGHPLGLDPDHPDFMAERRAHLHRLLSALLP